MRQPREREGKLEGSVLGRAGDRRLNLAVHDDRLWFCLSGGGQQRLADLEPVSGKLLEETRRNRTSCLTNTVWNILEAALRP